MLGSLLRDIANSVKKVFGIEEPDITTTETTDTSGIKPSEKIDVNGMGDRFSGESNVDGVSHETDGEGYETDFDTDKSNDIK
jgi:hypothetical protein